MSRFILHTKAKRTLRLRYLLMGLACLMTVGIAGYTVHCIGTARAKSRETVLIYTEEEFAQYLIDTESEEYNLNGRNLYWNESGTIYRENVGKRTCLKRSGETVVWRAEKGGGGGFIFKSYVDCKPIYIQ